MSERLGPLLSVYSSPLVIYSSPLVICSGCLLDELRTWSFKYFINMTIYLISFSAHFATIFSSELRVLFQDMFFSTHFCCKCLNTCYTHNFFYFMGILGNRCDIILLNVFLILLLTYILHKPIINFNDPFTINFLLWTSNFHFFLCLNLHFSYLSS